MSQQHIENKESKKFFYSVVVSNNNWNLPGKDSYIRLADEANIFEKQNRVFLICEKKNDTESVEIAKLLDKYLKDGYAKEVIERFKTLEQKATGRDFYRAKTPAIAEDGSIKRNTNNQIIYIKYGENATPKCVCIECDYLYKVLNFTDLGGGIKQLIVATANLL